MYYYDLFVIVSLKYPFPFSVCRF